MVEEVEVEAVDQEVVVASPPVRLVVRHHGRRAQASILVVNPNPHLRTDEVEVRRARYLQGYLLQGGLQVVVRVIKYLALGEFHKKNFF